MANTRQVHLSANGARGVACRANSHRVSTFHYCIQGLARLSISPACTLRIIMGLIRIQRDHWEPQRWELERSRQVQVVDLACLIQQSLRVQYVAQYSSPNHYMFTQKTPTQSFCNWQIEVVLPSLQTLNVQLYNYSFILARIIYYTSVHYSAAVRGVLCKRMEVW